MALKNLTFSQRLAAGCGCVVVLAGVLTFLGYLGLGLWIEERAARARRNAPAGWMDSLRILSRVPDLSGLTLARTDSGDGAATVYALESRVNIELAYRAAVGLGEATAEDSARWREVAADTSVEQALRIARRRDWRALDLAMARVEGAQRNILLLETPRLGPLRDAGRVLVIRAMRRLARGDRAGARTDLEAATALADQAIRHEPTMLGFMIGRAVLSQASRGWQRYAAVTRDTALARRAGVLVAWAGRMPGAFAGNMLAFPDSALVIAGDSSLAVGVRGEGLSQFVASRALTPRGFVFGMPGRELDRLRATGQYGPADFRRLVDVAAATAERLRFFGALRLLREAGRAGST